MYRNDPGRGDIDLYGQGLPNRKTVLTHRIDLFKHKFFVRFVGVRCESRNSTDILGAILQVYSDPTPSKRTLTRESQKFCPKGRLRRVLYADSLRNCRKPVGS